MSIINKDVVLVFRPTKKIAYNSLNFFLVSTDNSAREKAQDKEHVSSDSEIDGESKYKMDIKRVKW